MVGINAALQIPLLPNGKFTPEMVRLFQELANMSGNIDSDPAIAYAIQKVYADYGDKVSVSAKRKDLRKWGENANVGTAGAAIMTLPSSETQETLIGTNGITHISSDNAGDTMDIDFYEGHTVAGSNLTFKNEQTDTTINGQSSVALPTALCRATRARLSAPAAGNIYFHENGTLSSGVPTDPTEIHMIIPAGEMQTQKASTAVSSQDYWFITGATASVLEKTASWAQVRIEIKHFQDTYFVPVTQWIGVSDASGTVNIIGENDPILIIPKNYDVRLFAKSNTAGIYVAGGMQGPLAKVI